MAGCVAGEPELAVAVLDMKELEDIVERARAGQLSEADCQKLRDTVATLAWMQQELATKDITLARLRSLFGLNTSEKRKHVLPQRKTGDDQPSAPKPKQDVKPPKPKGHGRNGADAYTGAERIKVPHGSLAPGNPCPHCPPNKQGKVYTMSKPRRLVRIVGQAPLHATVYEQERLRCNLCGEVFTAEPPAGVGDEKYDASAVSMIAVLKYGTGMPFHRLERLEANLGIPLPAATQWDLVADRADQIAPAHDELIRQGAQADLIHNDDTSMRVIELRKRITEEQKSGEATTDRTGIFLTNLLCERGDDHRISLFFTGRNHAGENLTDLLKRRAPDLAPPLQMCDALDRNRPKDDVATELANCLVHGRRNFVNLLDSFPTECQHVIEVLGNVYAYDADARARGLSADERLRFHQEHSRPLMDGLKAWMQQQIDEKRVEPNSSLGRAISYMTKRWHRLTLFLRKAGAPLDNNICERALKKAILHRKNALFYKTANGAWVGDLYMSLIHTAELAGANPFDYLTALFRNAPAVARDPTRWMPWNYADAVAEPSTAPDTG